MGGWENQGNVANSNDGEEMERRWMKRDDKAEREGGEVVDGGGGAGEYTVYEDG